MPWSRSALPAAALLLLVATGLSAPRSGSAASLRSSVFGSGGTPASAAGRRSVGTIAQSTPIGIASAANKAVYAGFWKAYLGVLVPAAVLPTDPLCDALLTGAPNPFRSSTSIAFSLAREGRVSAVVFDLAGEQVRTLFDGTSPPGTYRVVWDGKDDEGRPVPSGLYFFQYRTDSYRSVRKMLMLK